MFSAEHVDSLFASTRTSLARSYQLLEEKRAPSAVLQAAASSPRRGLLRPPVAAGIPSTPFAGTLRTLEGLSHLGALTEVSRAMVARLEEKAEAQADAQASPVTEKARGKTSRFGLMQRMVKAAAVGAAQGAAMEGDAQQLWTDSALLSPEANGTGALDSSDQTSDAVGGAVIASLLVLCAFCVDAANALSTGDAAAVDGEEPLDKDVVGLLRQFASCVPPALLSTTVRTMVGLLRRTSTGTEAASTASPLPLALLSFPSLVAYTVLEGAPSVAAEAVFRPIETESGALLAVYLQSEAGFQQRTAACVLFVTSVARALLFALATAATTTSTATRVLSSLKRLVTVFVTPIETTFTASAARQGMTAALYATLVAPLTTGLNDALASAAALRDAGPDHDRTLESARALLHTGVYRLLMVLEGLGASELYVSSGKASAVAQQKQYQQRLRQSNGKLTRSIFSSLVEDRQLLLEDTNARSENGHRVLKITDGVRETPVVFAYIDDGAIFVKLGRIGKFRTATSVEEIFTVFETHS